MEIFLKNRINKLSYCYGLLFILCIETAIVFFVWQHQLQYLWLIFVYMFVHFLIPKILPNTFVTKIQQGVLKLVESIYLRSNIIILYMIFYYIIYAIVLYMVYMGGWIAYLMLSVFIVGRLILYVLCYNLR